MFGSMILFEEQFLHIVAISFTALIITELIMVCLTIQTWHFIMVISIFISLSTYAASVFLLEGDTPFLYYWLFFKEKKTRV